MSADNLQDSCGETWPSVLEQFMNCSAIFSPDRKYRYKLVREWQPTQCRVAWLMLNPSIADESRDDLTVKKCIGFSMNWGYGEIEVYNLFAWKSTNPQYMYAAKDRVGPDNDGFIERIPLEREIVLAYGVLPDRFVEREIQVLDILRHRKLSCLGMTASGFPRHPSRIGYATKREAFDLRPANPGNGKATR